MLYLNINIPLKHINVPHHAALKDYTMRYLIYPLLLSLSNLTLAANSPTELSNLQTDAQQLIKRFSGELRGAFTLQKQL